LMNARNFRIRPQLDDKILLAWNALIITAYCKAYAALGKEHYKIIAEKAINFIETKFRNNDGSYFHTYKNSEAKIGAFLDDYAYLIQTYIHLQEITGNQEYLESARSVTNYVIENFGGNENDIFYYTNVNQEDVVIRKREIYDGATPSGNRLMMQNLIYLSFIFDKKEWRELTFGIMKSISGMVIKYPTSFGIWSNTFLLVTMGMKEIVLIGQNFLKDLPDLLKKYLPNKIFQVSSIGMNKYPLLAFKFSGGLNTFFLCENYSCSDPEVEIERFIEMLC